MIKNLYIRHFRGLEQITLEKLTKVNILLGRNNCGKSTVLDALYLLSYPTQPQHLLEINDLRGYHSKSGEDFKYDFHNGEVNQAIEITADIDSSSRKLQIRHLVQSVSDVLITDRDTSRLKEKDYVILYSLKAENGESYETSLMSDHKTPEMLKVKQLEDFECAYNINYITPAVPYRNIEELFTIAVKNKQEQYIVEVLNSVDRRIKDVVIAGDQILVDAGAEQRIPLQLMGDGMRKIFSLIVNMSSCRGGIILIDEIDNGLHHTSMQVLWKAIVECASKFNVQVFATTHSIESLAALKNIYEDMEASHQEDLHLYTIRQALAGGHIAIGSNYSQFSHIINQDLEIR